MIKKILSGFYKWACKDNNSIFVMGIFWLTAGAVFNSTAFSLIGASSIVIQMLGTVLITAAKHVNPTYETTYTDLDGGEVKFTIKKKSP